MASGYIDMLIKWEEVLALELTSKFSDKYFSNSDATLTSSRSQMR